MLGEKRRAEAAASSQSSLESIRDHRELINGAQKWDEVRSLHAEAGMFVNDGIQEGVFFSGVSICFVFECL